MFVSLPEQRTQVSYYRGLSLFTFSFSSPEPVHWQISAKRCTLYKAFLSEGDSSLFTWRNTSFFKGDYNTIVKIYWSHFKIFSRTNGPISAKLGTKHPFVRGFQVYSNGTFWKTYHSLAQASLFLGNGEMFLRWVIWPTSHLFYFVFVFLGRGGGFSDIGDSQVRWLTRLYRRLNLNSVIYLLLIA